MQVIYQRRDGLPPEHDGAGLMPTPYERVRLSVPAREALVKARATVEQAGTGADGAPLYLVALAPDEAVPAGLVAVITGRWPCPAGYGIRLESEPPFPLESAGRWVQLDFIGCPVCGRPLVWYEAGFVPGYRVCTGSQHHHVLAR